MCPLVFATLVALAGPPAKVFPPEVSIGEDARLVLNGCGLCEWGVFGWDLYWAALYLEKKSDDAGAILAADRAKRIHLHFVRALSRKQMVDAFRAAFRANAGKDLPKYQAGLDELVGFLTAVSVGTDLVFTYRPGKGLAVAQARARDGKELGTIAGAEFGRMFFRLYLGSKPPDAGLKRGLLGKS